MLKERNYSVDTLKFICAVLVIFIHIGTPYYNYPLPLTRIAVPCFFMISGYFIFTEPDNMQRRLLKSTRRMLWIFLWSIALYFAYYAVTNGDWSIINWKHSCSFLFLNSTHFGFHLWYFSAYIYVLIIMLFVNRFRLWKPCFFLVPILLLCNLIFGKYDVLIFNHNFNLILSRNFLFMGIPYFALGCIIKKHWNALCVIKPKLIIRGGYLTIIILYLEVFLLKSYHLDSNGDIYFTTTFLALIVFLASLLIKQEKPNVWSKLGEEYSLYIYVLHPVVGGTINRLNHHFMPAEWTDGIYLYAAPFVVLVVTIAATYVLKKVRIIK